MKQGIHPKWFDDCVVTCSCGNTFKTGSINETLQIDICDKCHPFFTGEVRFVDRQGRVDRFLTKMKTAEAHQAAATVKNSKKQKPADQTEEEQKSYRDLLRDQQAQLRKSAKSAPNAQ
jgi:large subunit ribosomal protein L31